MKKYVIAEQFTELPGGRYIKDGEFSGEEFREKVLREIIAECLKNKEKLEIDFDGAYGYPPSFLEEAFGGLTREKIFTEEELKNTLKLISKDEPSLVSKVFSYIKDGEKMKKRGK